MNKYLLFLNHKNKKYERSDLSSDKFCHGNIERWLKVFLDIGLCKLFRAILYVYAMFPWLSVLKALYEAYRAFYGHIEGGLRKKVLKIKYPPQKSRSPKVAGHSILYPPITYLIVIPITYLCFSL